MHLAAFSDIASEFIDTVHSQVWCSVATVNSSNQPRLRVLHPIWENDGEQVKGWIMTGRTSLKAKHLEHSPYLSLCYMQDPLKPVYIDCRGEWADDPAEKLRIWELFRTTPEPSGYDPVPFFGSINNPGYGVLKLTPSRIELANLFGETRIWRTQ